MAVYCRAASSPPEKKEKHKADRNCLSSGPRLKAHTRGHPCRECWRQAGRTRPLIRHAPGACHQRGMSQPHPSLAAQGAITLRAGPFPRGASSPSPVFFLSLSPCAHRHLHCHASAGPRLRKIERRRSESDIWLGDTSQACLRLSLASVGPCVLAPCARWWLRLCNHVCADLRLCIASRSR